jgi:5-methyltetrahydropteroyltriglutamate--homocysteine methyltransferase
MRGSHDRIITSHVGSLPRPDDLIEANRKREDGESGDDREFQALLQSAVSDVVRREKEAGVDVPNDGEFGKSMGHAVNYGAWLSYAFRRLSGFQLDNPPEAPARPAKPGDLTIAGFAHRRDRAKFAAAYNDPNSGITIGARRFVPPVCIGPVKYIGQEAIKADIARCKAALKANGVDEGFMTAIAPGEAARFGNTYYKTDDECVFACADAMREEYKAIVDAGLILQLDDPGIAELWDEFVPEPSVEAYKRFVMVRVDALNQSIKGLPEDRIRFHLCWGSWHGPHTTDLPMRDIIEVLLAIKVNAYSFEAGNVRHEHEWEVWQDVKLPTHKFILPGVVSHATNVVEHPDLVAQRILRFTNIVGRERVIASTDCGLGGRIHPDIAWAKLEALAQGARVASRKLWG